MLSESALFEPMTSLVILALYYNPKKIEGLDLASSVKRSYKAGNEVT